MVRSSLRRLLVTDKVGAAVITLACVLTIGWIADARAQPVSADTAALTQQALERGLGFFETLRVRGGWPMAYSEDLKRRWGEHAECEENSITVQPPATPTVGSVYLRAALLLANSEYLTVARQAAGALVTGQLDNGGWWHEIRFDRNGAAVGLSHRATMDDNTTQGATMFVMEMAGATGASRYEHAARAALAFLLESQYPAGGWPQQHPVSRGYSAFYTLNDGTTNDCISTLLAGYRQFHDIRYLEAAKRAGDWLIEAQLPPPHRGWAQQYDLQMRPAAARWFEPAACCSAVTARVIRTLIELYRETRNDRYLAPIPDAIAWLKSSQLADGTWARFYEIGTNKPIYVTANRKVVYEPTNLRPGYGWKGSYNVAELMHIYQILTDTGRDALDEYLRREPDVEGLKRQARHWIDYQREDGSWPADGRITCGTFVQATTALCDLLEHRRPPAHALH